jgi:membrane protease YdiL (CAAX protease family)
MDGRPDDFHGGIYQGDDATDFIEIIKQVAKTITITDVIVCLPGMTLLGVWLLRTSLGRNALINSQPRRNNMPVYLPFIPFFVWLLVLVFLTFMKEVYLPDLKDWQSSYFDHLILCLGALAGIAAILLAARRHFARRLKGFGLSVRRIHKDFGSAALNLVTIYPLVAVALISTILLGKVIKGPEFEMQKHQELELMALYSQPELRVLIIVTVIFVMPVFEEMLFRGLFQTAIRSFLASTPLAKRLNNRLSTPWLAIVLSSGIFASVHAYAGHWPALFVLAVCMGYAYEKSGSLFRPIFIHAFFNATSIIATLTQPAG